MRRKLVLNKVRKRFQGFCFKPKDNLDIPFPLFLTTFLHILRLLPARQFPQAHCQLLGSMAAGVSGTQIQHQCGGVLVLAIAARRSRALHARSHASDGLPACSPSSRSCARPRPSARARTSKYARTEPHAYILNTPSHLHLCTYARTDALTHARTHARTHAITHARTHRLSPSLARSSSPLPPARLPFHAAAAAAATPPPQLASIPRDGEGQGGVGRRAIEEAVERFKDYDQSRQVRVCVCVRARACARAACARKCACARALL